MFFLICVSSLQLYGSYLDNGHSHCFITLVILSHKALVAITTLMINDLWRNNDMEIFKFIATVASIVYCCCCSFFWLWSLDWKLNVILQQQQQTNKQTIAMFAAHFRSFPNCLAAHKWNTIQPTLLKVPEKFCCCCLLLVFGCCCWFRK